MQCLKLPQRAETIGEVSIKMVYRFSWGLLHQAVCEDMSSKVHVSLERSVPLLYLPFNSLMFSRGLCICTGAGDRVAGEATEQGEVAYGAASGTQLEASGGEEGTLESALLEDMVRGLLLKKEESDGAPESPAESPAKKNKGGDLVVVKVEEETYKALADAITAASPGPMTGES